MSQNKKMRQRICTLLCCLIPMFSFVGNFSANAGNMSSAGTVADCNFNLDWPHKSVHEPGMVSSNGVINCKNPKAYIGVETWLYTVTCGCLFSYGKAKNDSGLGVYVNAAAADNCKTGIYYARAEFLMVEHNGTRHERSHKTSPVLINC